MFGAVSEGKKNVYVADARWLGSYVAVFPLGKQRGEEPPRKEERVGQNN